MQGRCRLQVGDFRPSSLKQTTEIWACLGTEERSDTAEQGRNSTLLVRAKGDQPFENFLI